MAERTEAFGREASGVPGSRLTHDDRRRISAWLAEGLGYAEIGRRLGRPTSTISREVARNAGPGDYLADHAQQTAGTRARRRRSVHGTEPPPGERSEAARAFVERFAGLLAGTGLTRMASRVFVCLITSDAGSLTAAELVRGLRVSPASVSKAIAHLETLELVGREPDQGGRRERYFVGDDVWIRAWRADTGAHAEVAEAARWGVEIFGDGTPAGDRLARMGGFFRRISEQMGGGSSGTTGRDALTALAALVYAARPLTVDDLAAALGWPRERAAEALGTAEHRPDLTDPLALRRAGPGTYAVTPRDDHLSPAQRAALRPEDHCSP
ncbi:GbsR/MarR family transcriptional regulator [Sphaerisporangium siamense]|uniref:DNA-binding transcriptional regulator GbsR (MarR family) n=1 Tax=Sphaerisporangium siamense TaxID=795645 RepID=A0A7W7D516_9ACTN|nr:helix-turn-helix domain-containing protein [Sphaerisporangium siamense]MBB4699093.1 DNA-binding transcriptional regulator GbsR (MarR family) [Sphaerisporangium siamense]